MKKKYIIPVIVGTSVGIFAGLSCGNNTDDVAREQWDARTEELTPNEQLDLCMFVRVEGPTPAARIMLNTPEDPRFNTPTDAITIDNFPEILSNFCGVE